MPVPLCKPADFYPLFEPFTSCLYSLPWQQVSEFHCPLGKVFIFIYFKGEDVLVSPNGRVPVLFVNTHKALSFRSFLSCRDQKRTWYIYYSGKNMLPYNSALFSVPFLMKPNFFSVLGFCFYCTFNSF